MIKRQAPTSLFGRSLLIIVLPVTIMQIAVTYAFFDAHWQTVNSHLTEGVAGDVAWVLKSYEESAERDQPAADKRPRPADHEPLHRPAEGTRSCPQGRRPLMFVAVDRSLRKALADRIDVPVWFDTARYPAYVDIRVKVPQGVMRIIAPKDRVFATKGHIFILWLTVATLLLTGISILFIRNQVRAIERLAEAADAFGRGVDLPFRPHGAREVRQAARAFLAMKARIQRHVDQRTTLLAAVSHDLRTPLTRLALELALSEPGARIEEMKRDVAEMEHMIDEYLAFARGEGAESIETVDLGRLLDEVSQSADRAGAQVVVDAEPVSPLACVPNALKRALSNLIMNAADHGQTVEVTGLRRSGGRGRDHHRRRWPGHPGGPLRGGVRPVRPAGRGPQSQSQRRWIGHGHRPRHRPRSRRRCDPRPLTLGRPARRGAGAWLGPVGLRIL